MTYEDSKKHIYTVSSVECARWEDRFETLAEAELKARQYAFKNGTNYGIFKLVAEAEKPSIVNDVKITAVQ